MLKKIIHLVTSIEKVHVLNISDSNILFSEILYSIGGLVKELLLMTGIGYDPAKDSD